MFQVFTNKYQVPKEKCPIIFNGVKDRLKVDIDDNIASPLHIIYSGGLSSNKGADKVLSLIEKYPDLSELTEIHWFGDCKPKFRKRLLNYTNINYYGRVLRKKFIEKLSKSDIILIPSKYEGCPMVLLEAFSYGVVPISSDGHGAMKNIIDNDKTGYIFQLSDWVSQTWKTLIEMSNNRDKLLAMKKSVRIHFKKHFDIRIVANSLLKLLSNPTVSRNSHPKSITVLKWHRPLRPDGLKAPLIDRFCINFGFLRKDGYINLPTDSKCG
jgi:glycosyltransferase involved in cell wall biosynthesis